MSPVEHGFSGPIKMMKTQRQAVIRDLVEREAITSQEQLRMRLKERGMDATQATLSRDIRELGLIKRAVDGAYRTVAALPQREAGTSGTGLARAIAEYLRNQEVVGHMIVLRTDPGQAQTLAVAIDRADVPEIVGTLAGDDTILVICREPAGARAVADRLTEGLALGARA
jgi:transcriptional regulator of arginine metabolism